jgi:hypothetical protein
MTSPFAHLPAAVRARLGELDGEWPDEPRSDCSACPLVVAGEAGVAYPFAMARDARCCTAQPQLANFLVGRVADAGVVRARIANRDGVSAWGIRATAGYDDAFPERAKAGFGRDVTMRCHFWVGGDHACGVWAGRSARCRAFFCRHERGLAGALSWSQAAGLGVAIESAIADHLVATLGGIAAEASDDALLAWYARCAVAADALDDAAALAIVRRVPPVDPAAPPDRIVHSQRGRLIVRLRAHRPRIGAVLVPAISAVQRDGDSVWLAGYSTFDAVRAPASIFAFLAKLDGTLPWRDALAGDVDEALVRELHRVGALRDPAGSDDPPESE